MSNYKYPLLYRHCKKRRRRLAQAIGLSPRRLQLKQRPQSKCDFTGEEMRRASEYLRKPAEKIFVKESKGYVGILAERGKYVSEEEAVQYAMERCGISPRRHRAPDAEFITWFTEWFYSGNWLTQEEYDELHI